MSGWKGVRIGYNGVQGRRGDRAALSLKYGVSWTAVNYLSSDETWCER